MSYQLSEAVSLEIAATELSGDNEYDGCYDTVTFALIHDCEDEYQQQAWRLGTQLSFGAHNVSLALHPVTRSAPSFPQGNAPMTPGRNRHVLAHWHVAAYRVDAPDLRHRSGRAILV
ncbi:MAG: hypothetical protein CM15mP74_04570 [Halieaceae bacterium]|nr:MAG: hypothetical protein CM15mP74_04570 [Halieaceae bacterium]